MNKDERIARHHETIRRLEEDREWVETTGFSISGASPQDIMAEITRQIKTYEAIIERLKVDRT